MNRRLPIAGIASMFLGMSWCAALPAQTLPATVPAEPGEADSRLQITIRKVDRTPTNVTLHMKDATVSDAFAALGKVSGVTFVEATNSLKQVGGFPAVAGVTFDVESQPFWVALRELSKQTGVNPAAWENHPDANRARPGAMLLAGSSAPALGREGPSHVSGSALFVARFVRRVSRVELTPPVSEESVTTLDLTAYVEPKLQLSAQVPRVRIDEAVDEKGVSLIAPEPERPERPYLSRAGRSWAFGVPIKLRQSTGSGKKLAKLRGAAIFTGPESIQMVEVPQIRESKGAQVTIAGQPVEISPLTVDAKGYVIHVQMNRKDADDARWTVLCGEFEQRIADVRLVDKYDRALPSKAMGPGGTSKKSTDITIHFYTNAREQPSGAQPAGDPVKLLWEIPQDLSEIAIPFEFADLPLP